jgi:hypothetical protein
MVKLGFYMSQLFIQERPRLNAYSITTSVNVTVTARTVVQFISPMAALATGFTAEQGAEISISTPP